MNLRADEIEFLGTDRCYCGHLRALHDLGSDGWCEISDAQHHFCSVEIEQQHFAEQKIIVGNPKVGRQPTCRACRMTESEAAREAVLEAVWTKFPEEVQRFADLVERHRLAVIAELPCQKYDHEGSDCAGMPLDDPRVGGTGMCPTCTARREMEADDE